MESKVFFRKSRCGLTIVLLANCMIKYAKHVIRHSMKAKWEVSLSGNPGKAMLLQTVY